MKFAKVKAFDKMWIWEDEKYGKDKWMK